jgi:hypothetical protein
MIPTSGSSRQHCNLVGMIHSVNQEELQSQAHSSPTCRNGALICALRCLDSTSNALDFGPTKVMLIRLPAYQEPQRRIRRPLERNDRTPLNQRWSLQQPQHRRSTTSTMVQYGASKTSSAQKAWKTGCNRIISPVTYYTAELDFQIPFVLRWHDGRKVAWTAKQ